MIFVHNENISEYPATICQLNDESIENVIIFRYLGPPISFNEHLIGDTELNLRIDIAVNKFHQHGKKFMDHKIRLKSRVNILNSLVWSRLTFACQTWTLSARHRELLNSTYCCMLRRMIWNDFKKKEDGLSFVYTKLYIYHMCGAEVLEEYICSQQKRYRSHNAFR